MAESLVDIEDTDPFRAGAALSCLVMVASYLLPWATVDGVGRQTGSASVVTPNTTVQGSISPQEIAYFPEIVVAVAAVALLVVALRWTIFWQFLVGVFGLGAGFASLVFWAVVDSNSQGEFLELGPYEALYAAYDPATGAWLAIFGSIGLVLTGFAAATRTYVVVKRLADQQE
jgi:hypothetical protein